MESKKQFMLHSPQTERELIGSIIITPSNYLDIDWLMADHFYDYKNKRIWEVIVSLFLKSVVPEITTIVNELDKLGYIDEELTPLYVTKVSGLGHIMNHIEHAQHIYDLAKKREASDIFMRAYSGAIEKHVDIKDTVDKAILKLTDIFSDIEKGEVVPVKRVISEARERILRLKYKEEKPDTLHSGMGTFIVPNGLVIIAARPSMGKTSFCIQLCNNLAVDQGIPIGLFELEMGSEQIARWMLSQRTEIANDRLATGEITEEEVQEIESEVAKIEKAPLFIDDTAGMNVIQLRSKALQLKREHDIRLVAVDYLQLMSGMETRGRIKNRENEVSEISRQLKILSKELNIPVVALSQINRAVENRSSKEPRLSDLRESGAIEQDADMVAFLYRPEYYDIDEFEDGTSTEGVAQLIVGKYRDGRLSTYDLKFIPERVTFKTMGLMKKEDVF